MFQVGDQVVYSVHGVCRILDTEERQVDSKRVRYFILEPIDQVGTRFMVPSENPAALSKLRHVIGREDLESLLRSDKVRQSCWIDDEGRRKQYYRELIVSGDRERLLQMIATLHQHKHTLAQTGKRLHLCDDNFLKDAQKLLTGEFSLVLQMPADQVGGYIRDVMLEHRS